MAPSKKLAKYRYQYLFRLLNVKNDVEFIKRCDQFIQRNPDLINDPEGVAADEHLNFLIPVIKNELKLGTLGRLALTALSNISLGWNADNFVEKHVSKRLIRAGSLAEDYEIGDTFIVPQGVYQIRLRKNNTPTAEKVLSCEELEKAHLQNLLPTEDTNTTEILYSNNGVTKEFDSDKHNQLNKLLVSKNGLWIGGYNVGYMVTQILLAITQAANEQLRANTKKQPHLKGYRFFERSGTAQASKTSLSVAQNPSLISKADVSNDTKDLTAIAENMQTVSDEYNTITLTKPEPEISTTIRVKPENEVVELVQNNATQTTVLMSARANQLQLHKPFIRNPRLTLDEKAHLCLKAWGIPPLHGRNHIDIKDASPKLRTAIMKCFMEIRRAEEKNNVDHNLTNLP